MSCRRDDTSGIWPCTDLPAGPASRPAAGGTAQLPVIRDKRAASLAPSLVQLTFDMPFSLAGISERNYHGTGLIVDAERGLVVTDRNTVPVSLGDVRLTFGGSLEIPGKVVYVHPLHNLAVVSYDPKLIGTTPVKSARLNPAPLEEGAAVTVVGMDADGQLKSRATTVSSLDPLELPLSRTMQFRDANLEAAQLLNPPGDFDGVLVDKDSRVQALWSSFPLEGRGGAGQTNRGVAIDLVREMLDHVRANTPLHTLDAEFSPLPLTEARRQGLPDAWAAKLTAQNPERRQVQTVARITGGAASARVLRQGDLILRPAGHRVSRRGARSGGSPRGRGHRVARPDGAGAARSPRRRSPAATSIASCCGPAPCCTRHTGDERTARHAAAGRVRGFSTTMVRRPRVTACCPAVASSRWMASHP